MRKIFIIIVTMILFAVSCYASFRYGIEYAITKAEHYTIDCNAPEAEYDLYIDLPDGNTYLTTLFIC